MIGSWFHRGRVLSGRDVVDWSYYVCHGRLAVGVKKAIHAPGSWASQK